MNCDPDNVEEEAFVGASIFPSPNSGVFSIHSGEGVLFMLLRITRLHLPKF